MDVTHPDATKTGTIQLTLTTRGWREVGAASATAALNAGQRARILKHCYAFVQRASDKAIQSVDMARLSEIQTV